MLRRGRPANTRQVASFLGEEQLAVARPFPMCRPCCGVDQGLTDLGL
jgi:hypothetical protein